MEKKKLIEFRDIVKNFDGQIVLKGINLDIYENEFVTLLGPSGCGKTTLLRILGGFIDADEGNVIFDGEEISKKPPYQRELNTVFQKYALFPHLSVYENIAFGLKIKKMSKDVIDQKVMKMLKLIGLEGYENKNTTLLSGGQQQRVAIARALVNEPKVLLLDEPLAALDLKLRKEMQYELKRIQQEVGITFIFVTHDQEEALTMSDKIVVMKNGEIQQVGTPEEIYNEPANSYVANFIGESNILPGTMLEDYKVRFDDITFDCVDFGFKPNEAVDVVIRPEDIKIIPADQAKLTGIVESVVFKGVHYEMIVKSIIGRFDEYLEDDIANNDYTRVDYTSRVVTEMYTEAKADLEAYLKGEKTSLDVPVYVTSDLEIDGQTIWADTELGGEITRRPVFFIGYGHGSEAKQYVPEFPDWGVNSIQCEAGPDHIMTLGRVAENP